MRRVHDAARHAVEQSSQRFSAKASRRFLRGGARHRRELVAGQQVVELPLRLGEALLVERVHHVHDAVDGREVVLPEPPRRLVAAEVEGLEPDVADDQLVLVRVQRRLVDLHAVLLEHVQQRRLPSIVQPEEEDLCVLVREAYTQQRAVGSVRARSVPGEGAGAPKLLSMSHTQLMRNMAAAAEAVARGSTTR